MSVREQYTGDCPRSVFRFHTFAMVRSMPALSRDDSGAEPGTLSRVDSKRRENEHEDADGAEVARSIG